MAVATARSVSGRPDQCHVWCTSCWWGGDVPKGKAVEIANVHAASPEHWLNELQDALVALQVEGIRDERGH